MATSQRLVAPVAAAHDQLSVSRERMDCVRLRCPNSSWSNLPVRTSQSFTDFRRRSQRSNRPAKGHRSASEYFRPWSRFSVPVRAS